MKKGFLAFAIVGVLSILLYSCSSPLGGGGSGSPSSYTNQVLPTDLIQKVPSSLSSGASSSSSGTAAYARTATSGTTSGGYEEMKSAVTWMGSMAKSFVVMGFIIDAIISQNSLSPGIYPSENVTLTTALYNAINAQLPSSDQISSSEIGQSETVANVDYSTTGSGPFTDSVSFSETSGASTATMKYAWSTDKTKLQVTMTMSGMSMTYAFDTGTNSSAFKFSDTAANLSFTLAVEDSSSSSNGGAYVYETSGSGNSSTFSAWGYADDSGGLVEASFGPTSSSYSYYLEGFDQSGNLLYSASDTTTSSTAPAVSSSTGWTVSTNTSTAPISTYGGDLSTASQTSTYSAINLL